MALYFIVTFGFSGNHVFLLRLKKENVIPVSLNLNIVDVMSLHGEFYKFKLYEQCHFSSFVLSGDCNKVKIVIVFSKYVAEILEQFYNTQQLISICRNAW